MIILLGSSPVHEGKKVTRTLVDACVSFFVLVFLSLHLIPPPPPSSLLRPLQIALTILNTTPLPPLPPPPSIPSQSSVFLVIILFYLFRMAHVSFTQREKANTLSR